MKLNFYICFFLSSLLANGLFAQQNFPFTLHKRGDIVVSATGLLLSGSAFFAEKQIKPFTPQDIENLDKASIKPAFDRSTTQFWSPAVQNASDISLAVSGLGAFSLTVTQVPKRKNWFTLGVMGAETFFFTYGLTGNAKAFARRARPFTYNPDVDETEKLTKDARQSFFSGHTSMAAASCMFSAEIFATLKPNSPWKPWVRAGSICLPATVGFLRVRGGKHFPTDVLTGYVVGALVGTLVPRLHRKKDGSLSLIPSASGARLVWNMP